MGQVNDLAYSMGDRDRNTACGRRATGFFWRRMKLRTPLALFVLSFLAAPLFAAADSNSLTATEKSQGWKLLFDGKSLNGWRGYKTEEVGAPWKVQDGVITLTAAKAGDL